MLWINGNDQDKCICGYMRRECTTSKQKGEVIVSKISESPMALIHSITNGTALRQSGAYQSSPKNRSGLVLGMAVRLA